MFPLTTIVAVSLALMCQTAASQESLPLADAIKAFNEKAAEHPIGKEQPPLTEEEAIAAIRAWEHAKSKWPMSDEQYKVFKNIAESRTLPPNASFYWETGYQPLVICVIQSGTHSGNQKGQSLGDSNGNVRCLRPRFASLRR